MASSASSKFNAVSHSSHKTSITPGLLSSDTSTRLSSSWTTCICSVFTRKLRAFPQVGHVNGTQRGSLNLRNCMGCPEAGAMQIGLQQPGRALFQQKVDFSAIIDRRL